MKIETLPLVIVTALALPAGAMPAEDSSSTATQNREAVQEMSTVEQQSRWEQTVRQHDRNGDGRLDERERLTALERTRLQNEEMVRQLSGSPSGTAAAQGDQRQIRDRDRVQIQDRDRVQAQDQQQLEMRKQAMIRLYDTDNDGRISDTELTKALAALDRERDAMRDRLKDQTAAKDQTKDQAKDQTKDQLKQQDRTFPGAADLDRDRRMNRDRVSPSSQPRRGGGGRGR